MQLRSLLTVFLTSALYPLWLLAGAADYLCHRRTDIAHTSGSRESWLHVAQFATLAVIVVMAVMFEITLAVLILMAAALLAHTILSYVDVSFTLPRRHISPFEQHVHGFMDVIPIIAVCLIAILNWEMLTLGNSSAPSIRLKDEPLPEGQALLLLGSFFVLAGAPVFEELFRTRRADSAKAMSAMRTMSSD